MARPRKTRAQIQAQLNRALASINARSEQYPNLPRSGYALSQQEGYVRRQQQLGKKVNFNARGINKIIDFGDNQQEKRENQLRTAASNLMAKASGGRG